ncbi:hypothetical protein [Nitratidesulfovibrio oxamicus]|uniref:hypothetical protein n=1 Tax=Nitratidesulfovibrio oxamicus TaxID=32016 RepID=UPI001E4F4807|nr:hypothetical protein [Nitratidesulfovibrio oxamicus]
MLPHGGLAFLADERKISIWKQPRRRPTGPHLVNTWNRDLKVLDGNRIAVPVGGMRRP